MNSEAEHLMTITDRFQIEHLGLVLAPDFSVPDGKWSDQTHRITLESPDGHRFEVDAVFGLSHFNIRDPDVSLDRRWRVTVRMPESLKEQIPVGTKVFASRELVAILRQETKT